MDEEQEEAKLVISPPITFEEFRAHIDACLDSIEHDTESGETQNLEDWLEVLDAKSAEEE